MDSETKRSSFTGKLGFILAAAGSAVGLGNIWRFPYLAAKYGGGIFLLVYIILSVTFGFALMVAEVAIGRKTQQSPLGAFKTLNKRFSWVGILATVIPVLILPYYSVIGGWVTKYMVGFMTGSMGDMANDSYFGDYIGKIGEPIIWFVLFIAVTALIVIFGVQKGVEKVSKVMMPALVILMLFIVIYSLCTIDGAWSGVIYYIKPDFSHFSIMTVVAAMGQLFYSMSLAMGIMITFGSYMKKDISIEKSTHQIEIFDTGIAFLAGLMIVPAVFAFSGGDPAALGKGPGLMFITLPKVFNTMPGGAVIGTIFFMMVLLAALTSAISLMETIVSVVMDKFKLKRWISCLVVLGISLLLGLPSALGFSVWAEVKILGMQFLDLFDFVSNSVLMPVVALATAIFVGFILKPQTLIEEAELYGKFKAKKLFEVMIKWIAPVFILAILVSSILDVFGIVKI
jgi:NSS family neurotransmitter:Na+ symporter